MEEKTLNKPLWVLGFIWHVFWWKLLGWKSFLNLYQCGLGCLEYSQSSNDVEHGYEGVIRTLYTHSVSPEISLKSEDFKPGRHDGLHMEHETRNLLSRQDVAKMLQYSNLTNLEQKDDASTHQKLKLGIKKVNIN